jgi:orotidine-5'-phosphate decarboxylase
VDFLTVHGDPQIVKSACEARGSSKMKILAVTLLTSLDRSDLTNSLIISGTISELVVKRAQNAFRAGADGVIASPNEVKKIRALKESNGKLIVTPGIRFSGTPMNDQKRTSDPLTAFQNGSDFIVVGRPIFASEDPLKEVKKIQLASRLGI